MNLETSIKMGDSYYYISTEMISTFVIFNFKLDVR